MSLSGKTRIRMADGTNKEIKDLYIGDKLLTSDGIETIEDIYSKEFNDSVYDIILEDKDKMIVCENMILKTMF